jgi:hypothetical protein
VSEPKTGQLGQRLMCLWFGLSKAAGALIRAGPMSTSLPGATPSARLCVSVWRLCLWRHWEGVRLGSLRGWRYGLRPWREFMRQDYSGKSCACPIASKRPGCSACSL